MKKLLLLVLLLTSSILSQNIIRGPYLQKANPAQITVSWKTDTVYQGQVVYGNSPDRLNLRSVIGQDTAYHHITISNLKPGKKYYYGICGLNGTLVSGEDYFFTTETHSTRVWIIGDSGTSRQEGFDVKNSYLQFTDTTHTDLWIMLGDNAYDHGIDEEYQEKVFDKFPELLGNSVLWPVPGNHDLDSANVILETGAYFDAFNLPIHGESGGVASYTELYYSFDYANIHFIALASSGIDRSITGEMATWLLEDLLATEQDWIVAYWHHPPYSKGSHDSDDEIEPIEMRENILPILEQHGVDIVFAGHSHVYERTALIRGHYGSSDTFDPKTNIVQFGPGPYIKSLEKLPYDGTVYVVNGSAGRLDEDLPGPHPAIIKSYLQYGSVVLDVDGTTLKSRFLSKDGQILDEIKIKKQNTTGIPPWIDSYDFVSFNYPNPFNPTTTIRFTINKPFPVLDLKIYNINGQLVYNAQMYKLQAGISDWTIDLADRPSGIYIYKISIEDDFLLGKMLLTK